MTDLYHDAALEAAAVRMWRTMAITGGIISIGIGLVLLIWPKQTLLVVAALFGVWLIIIGVVRLATALTDRGGRGSSRVLVGLLGAGLIVLGIVCLANLVGTLNGLALLIALVWIVAGVLEIASAFARGLGGWQRVGTLAFGALSVLGGLVVLLWPEKSLTVLVWITGLWLILLGLLQLFLAWRAGRLTPAAY